MRGFLRVVVIGSVLMGAPHLAELEPLSAALATVAAGVLLAAILSGGSGPAIVGLGALGALAHAALAPLSVALAGGALVAAAAGARALRARSTTTRVATLAIAFVGGGIGTWVVWSHAGAAFAVHGASIAVGAVLSSAALLVPVDDRIAWRLRELASRASGPLRQRLLRGIAIRRRYVDAEIAISRRAKKRLERAWQSLVRTAAARLEANVGAKSALDARLAAYVAGLGRATRAAVQACALEKGVDDAAFAELFIEGDDMAARAEALAEAEAVVTRSA